MPRNIFLDFNLSPQGDGNSTTKWFILFFSISTYPRKGTETSVFRHSGSTQRAFQLTPARGRELNLTESLIAATHISTYPRKGTETDIGAFSSIQYAISTYPRKGTETSLRPAVVRYAIRFQLIPVRGQKNSASKKMRSFSFANLNSLFSVGYSSMNRAAAAFSLPWLSYCNKMCYNRANSKHLLQNTQTNFLFIVQFFHNL